MFTSSFPIWMPFFFLLVWLLWLALPVPCWIRVVKVGMPVLFLILMETLFIFPCWVCYIWPLLCWDISPLFPLSLEFFFIIGCFILSNAFSAPVDMIKWFLSFILFMWCIILIYLQILNQTCIPGINPTWSWYMIFLMFCWTGFANILLRVFVSVFIRDIGLYFTFFVVSSSEFGIRITLAL